jgi:hypothetical protein
MNKLMTAILLVGLSGAAFAVDEAPKIVANPNLPTALMENLKTFQATNPGEVPSYPDVPSFEKSFSAFSDATNAQIKTSKQDLVKIIKEKGYDSNVIAYADMAYSLIEGLEKDSGTLNKTALESLSNVENLPQLIANNRNALSTLITFLGQYQPQVPTTFPGKCYNYDADPSVKTIIGRMDYSSMRTWVFNVYETAEHIVSYPVSPDVGQIHQGQEANRSRTPGNMVEKAWLGLNKEGKEAVFCVGTPYKPAIPLTPPHPTEK